MRNTVLFVAVLGIQACGGSSSSPVDSGSGPDVKTGCELAASLCAKLDQCAPFLLAAVYGDLSACSERLTKACTAQMRSSGSGMTEASLQICADALDAATCTDVFGHNVSTCSMRGTLVDGATCGDSNQCLSGFCALGGTICGVCAGKQAAGSACASGSNDECQPGLVCSSGKICAQPAAVGGACDDTTQPCLTGAFCTTAKTCALTVAAGQPCPGAYLNLGDGTVCLGKDTSANPQTCAKIGTASVGQPCGLAPGNGLPATLCAPGSVAACTLISGAIQLFGFPTKGICAAPIQDGFTCNATDTCLPGAQCIAGTCQIPSGRYCQ